VSLRHHSTTCYQYDALGRRTEKTTVHYDKYEKKQTTATISFDWQGLRLSGERTRIHPEQYVQYIYNEASYEPVARVIIHTSQNTHEQTEQLEYFHTLQSALPTELTNAEGDILWQADYRLFGELKVQQRRNRELYQQNLRFAGQYYDNETGLHYNTFRYYDPNCGRFTQQDLIGLAGGINLYQYAPNPLTWVDPWGLSCTGKMQPYRFDDVRVKGSHLDISVDGRKITEAKLGLDRSGNLVWERFGDMKGASTKSLNQADKYIRDLMNDKKIMGQAKTQVTQTIGDFKRILNDPSSSKNSIGLAERGMNKFSKMLEKLNGLD